MIRLLAAAASLAAAGGQAFCGLKSGVKSALAAGCRQNQRSDADSGKAGSCSRRQTYNFRLFDLQVPSRSTLHVRMRAPSGNVRFLPLAHSLSEEKLGEFCSRRLCCCFPAVVTISHVFFEDIGDQFGVVLFPKVFDLSAGSPTFSRWLARRFQMVIRFFPSLR